MTYVPSIGELIPVHLPYETIRAEVIHVFNDDEIAVNLSIRPAGDQPRRSRRAGLAQGHWRGRGRNPRPLILPHRRLI